MTVQPDYDRKEDSHSDSSRFPSRRELLAAAGISLGLVVPSYAADAPTPSYVRPDTEGFFFVVGDRKNTDAERIFFLKSSWLPFFEITDLYTDQSLADPHSKKKNVVQKIRDRSQLKWDVLYSEELDSSEIKLNPLQKHVIDVLDSSGDTYLAMSISPSIT